jgi:hypothetical protein|tara:strand:- start:2495 stop:2941 length:447 start_codon:yes stop_codon:yes gene_type:complete
VIIVKKYRDKRCSFGLDENELALLIKIFYFSVCIDLDNLISPGLFCWKMAENIMPTVATGITILMGSITHIRDGDTVLFNGIPLRFAALDCPEKVTAKGDYATKVANQFNGLNATCELTVPKYVKSEIIGAVARELIFLKDFRNYYLT